MGSKLNLIFLPVLLVIVMRSNTAVLIGQAFSPRLKSRTSFDTYKDVNRQNARTYGYLNWLPLL